MALRGLLALDLPPAKKRPHAHRHPTTDAEIAATFPVMAQQRPHLTADTHVARIRQLMASDGFHLACLSEDGEVKAVAGYRILDMLYCGRLLSIDDLASDEAARSGGHGKATG